MGKGEGCREGMKEVCTYEGNKNSMHTTYIHTYIHYIHTYVHTYEGNHDILAFQRYLVHIHVVPLYSLLHVHVQLFSPFSLHISLSNITCQNESSSSDSDSENDDEDAKAARVEKERQAREARRVEEERRKKIHKKNQKSRRRLMKRDEVSNNMSSGTDLGKS